MRTSRLGSSRLNPFRVRLEVESLEVRIVPYALSGGAWPQPQLITISFVPDGTIVGTTNNGYAYSNLFAKFNAKFGSTAAWQNAVITAAQTWAQYANINFTVVSDNGTAAGQGAFQQGDPGMGVSAPLLGLIAYPNTTPLPPA